MTVTEHRRGNIMIRLGDGEGTVDAVAPISFGAGKGRLLARGGETHEEWLVVDGLDAAEWTAHTNGGARLRAGLTRAR